MIEVIKDVVKLTREMQMKRFTAEKINQVLVYFTVDDVGINDS